MIKNILVSLGIAIWVCSCSTPQAKIYKQDGLVQDQETIIPCRPIKLKSGKMAEKKSQGEYKDVRFDIELGFYTGRKGAGVYILDSHKKAISDGFHRIYRQEDLLIGEKGSSMHILDPTTYRPSVEGYHRIHRGKYGHLIGSQGAAEYMIDSDGRKQGDYRKYKQAITDACTAQPISPTFPMNRNMNINPAEKGSRHSENPASMKPFAKVDMFGKPTVFSPDFGKRK